MTEEQLYGEAELLLGYNAKALKAMALMAYEHRKNKDAMRVFSFVWGRNARLMAKAVARWPDWFGDKIEAEPDELLCLFAMAQLKPEQAEELYNEWRKHSWRAWQVRERVDSIRDAGKQPRRRVYAFDGAEVQVHPGHQGIVDIMLVDMDIERHPDFKHIRDGKYDVRLSPVKEKKANKT